MVSEMKNEYTPDYVSCPGTTLKEILTHRGMMQAELAERTGRTPKLINEIIKGKAPITPETAIQLERALTIPASFWNNRQRQYDEFIARTKEAISLKKHISWVKDFPYCKMAQLGWVSDTVDKTMRVQNLLNYFGVVSPDSWCRRWKATCVAFRKSRSLEADQYALAAWLRRGELVAQSIECDPYDRNAFVECLVQIRALTGLRPSEFQPAIVEKCAKCGVAVVFVRELPKTASGATRWISSSKALIQLSLKYKTDDHLWFTFFHEAAHILQHGKRSIYIENQGWETSEESEANAFAEKFLIPPTEMRKFLAKNDFRCDIIRAFAKRIGIAPGIVVGQLQNKKSLPYSRCNDLKRRLTWSGQ